MGTIRSLAANVSSLPYVPSILHFCLGSGASYANGARAVRCETTFRRCSAVFYFLCYYFIISFYYIVACMRCMHVCIYAAVIL